MKKNGILLLAFVVLGSAAFYFLKTKTGENSRGSEAWDMQFSVPNTAEIQRIKIADRQGRTAQLDRQKDGSWQFNGKYRARQDGIDNLLETLSKTTVKYIPPNAAVKGMMDNLAAFGIRVELFNKDDKPIKTFYVGGVTADDRGTYMIMEGSQQPYVVHIPYQESTLRTRFYTEEDKWRDRTVFEAKPAEIEAVSIEYPQYQAMSFNLQKVKAGEYQVTPFYPNQTVNHKTLIKGKAESLLILFEKLQAEGIENANPRRDSVVNNLVPFAAISLKKTDGSQQKLRVYPIYPVDLEGNFVPPDDPVPFNGQVLNYFAYAEPSKDFFVINHAVFGKVFAMYPWFFEPVTADNALKK